MAAVVFVVNYFREYLLGRELIVYSDHLILQYFKSIKNPLSRITKSIFKLIEYDIMIKHKAGSANLAADSLSSFPKNLMEIEKLTKNEDISMEVLETLQANNEFCSNILKALKGIGETKFIRNHKDTVNNILFYKQWDRNVLLNLIVIPKELVYTVLKSYQESIFSRNFGITKTIAKLKQK